LRPAAGRDVRTGAAFFAAFFALAATFARAGCARFVAAGAFFATAFFAGAGAGAATAAFGFATGASAFTGAAFTGAAVFLAGGAGATFGFAAAAAGVDGGAFGLFFGRPPFLANCASANILAKASLASAISWACEIRRSWSARSFSWRYSDVAAEPSICQWAECETQRFFGNSNLLSKPHSWNDVGLMEQTLLGSRVILMRANLAQDLLLLPSRHIL
jgi:hypothetical protein